MVAKNLIGLMICTLVLACNEQKPKAVVDNKTPNQTISYQTDDLRGAKVLSGLDKSQIKIKVLNLAKFQSAVNRNILVSDGVVGNSVQLQTAIRKTKIFCQVIPTGIFSTIQENMILDVTALNEGTNGKLTALTVQLSYPGSDSPLGGHVTTLDCLRGEKLRLTDQDLQGVFRNILAVQTTSDVNF